MIDLRLVPAALSVWVTAWLLTGPGAGASGPATWVAAALVAATCLHLGLTAVRTRGAGRPAIAHTALAAACVLAVTASAHVQLAGRAPLADLAEQRVTAMLTGVVVSQPEPFSFASGPPEAGQHRWVLAARTVEARGVGSTARAHVQVLSGTAPRYGATVTVSGALRPADAGAAEAARLNADGASEIRAPPSALRVLDTHRAALLDVTDPLPAQGRGLVPGAAIGDTTRLPDDLAEEMRTTGLTHITAVSGGHFAVVVAVLTLLCSLARLPRPVRVALVALASLAFVALVRPEPAVLRAAVMAAFALTGVALGRPSQSVPALAASVVGLLVVDPWLARSYGFALSAAATGGLVLLAAPLAARLAPWTGDAAAFALAVPLAAQAACGPVLVLLDPSVSTVSVLANLLAAPALVPATVLGLVATVLAPGLPTIAGLVAWAASGATWWIAAVAHWCATLPGAVVPWLGGPPGALLLAALTGVVLWVVLRRAPRSGWPESWRATARSSLREVLATRRRRRTRTRFVALLAAGAVAVLVVVVAVPRLATRSGIPQDWLVAACDVGQGDALALRTGPASAVVVDVGPDGPAAGRCLDDLGVARVDLLVLSHFHADHVGGLGPVLAGREVAAALVSPVPEPAANAAATGAALAAAGVPVDAARTGDRGTAGTPDVAGAPGGRRRGSERLEHRARRPDRRARRARARRPGGCGPGGARAAGRADRRRQGGPPRLGGAVPRSCGTPASGGGARLVGSGQRLRPSDRQGARPLRRCRSRRRPDRRVRHRGTCGAGAGGVAGGLLTAVARAGAVPACGTSCTRSHRCLAAGSPHFAKRCGSCGSF